GHLLEITVKFRRTPPVLPGGGIIPRAGAGEAQVIVNVRWIGQEMAGFAEILGGRQSALEKLQGAGGLVCPAEFRAAQRQMGTHVLFKRLSFAAFPRLELACGNNGARLFMLACLVVEGAKLNGKVITLLD